MEVFNKTKVKKWINANKRRLIYNHEQGYILNGFMMLKVDKTVKEVMRDMLIREESFTLIDGEFEDIVDCEKFINVKGLVKLDDTKLFIRTNSKGLTRVFNTPKGESIFVQNAFFEPLSEYIEPVFKGTNAVNAVYMYVNDILYGLFLPIRTNYDYRIEKIEKPLAPLG